MELIRRMTQTFAPGYEPDGYGFVQRTTKLVCCGICGGKDCPGADGDSCYEVGVAQEAKVVDKPEGRMPPGTYVTTSYVQGAPPETLTAQLGRFLFQITSTETSLAELKRDVEKLRASL